MMHIVKKSYFTLLELLIVLFIISLGIILTGVKIKEMYGEQRFLSETQQVLSHLAMAQDLMLIMDTDVQVKIAPAKGNGQMHLWLEVEKPIEEPWARLIERKLPLVAIQSMEFEESAVKDLTLQFAFGRMSKGKLILFEGEQNKTKHTDQRQFEIELLGYPCPLGVKKKESKEQTKSEKSESLYPVEVYEKLYADPIKKKTKS